jgi:hypothetical protein
MRRFDPLTWLSILLIYLIRRILLLIYEYEPRHYTHQSSVHPRFDPRTMTNKIKQGAGAALNSWLFALNVQKEPFTQPSIADVLEVKTIFAEATELPLEVIDRIIDLAEYWTHSSAKMKGGPVRTLHPDTLSNVAMNRVDKLLVSSLCPLWW